MDETGTVIFRSAHPLAAVRYKDGPPRAVSWGGMSFEPDERGVNMVPVEALGELTQSHGMEGVPETDLVAAPKGRQQAKGRSTASLAAAAPIAELTPQTKDGGAVRSTVFPAEGEHPEGGPQPALGPVPTWEEIQASQSEKPRD